MVELAAGIDFEVEATIVAAVACCCRSGRDPPPHGRVVAERAAGDMLLLAVRGCPRSLFLGTCAGKEGENERVWEF